MIRRVALVALVLLSLAGCATIPTSGAVSEGRAEVGAAPYYIFTPVGPTSGATQDEIVRGFVQAQQGSTFKIAREFLTSSFAERWNPNARVYIHDVDWTTKPTSDSTVAVTVPYTATLNASGVYTPTQNTKTLSFTLVQVRGQWRISAAPDGILLPRSLFPRTYQAATLQYFSPDFQRLVPDTRWFPARAQQQATVIDALLAGQATQLGGGATVTAFPAGSRLAVAPTVVSGVTMVSLDVPGRPSATEQARMYQQLFGSLDLTSPSQLQLAVDGRNVAPSVLQNPQPDTRPAVLMGGRFGLLGTAGVVENALGKRIASLKPSAITTVARQGWAVVLSSSGVQVVTATGERVVDTRAGLVAPTVDQNGWVYSIPKDDPSALAVFDRSGRRSVLRASLPGTSVTAIEVSPDGTRLLALVQGAEGSTEPAASPEAVVYGIERDSAGTPIALTQARYTESFGATAVRSATWMSDSQIAVLTVSSDQEQIVAQQLGGLATDLGQVSDVASLVGATGTSDLRVLLATGDIQVNSNNAWESEFPSAIDASVLAIQR